MTRVAFITGITGQDGSYLAELLLDKGYRVWGLMRRSSSSNTARIDHLCRTAADRQACIDLVEGDMTDGASLIRLLRQIEPDEIYNLAAQSHVDTSFGTPDHTAQVDGIGALRLLEAVSLAGLVGHVRYYQASTSELFGRAQSFPLSETSRFEPRSPYAIAKEFAHRMTVYWRDAHRLHASNGILFNHESPRRGERFVTRKIALAVAAVEHGTQEVLHLGNLDARRDWGHARDYVDGMWRMLQRPHGDDYVLATGVSQSVRAFVERAFSVIGRRIEWEGQGVAETGRDSHDGRILVRVDPHLWRAAEVDRLEGDASKARLTLGWEPRTGFAELVEEMVRAEMEKIRQAAAYSHRS